MKRAPIFLALVVATSIFTPIQNAAASKTTVSLAVQSTPNAGESLVTFYGQVKPAAKGAITIDTFDGVTWKVTPLKTTSAASGAWRITTVATAIKAEGQYRARVTIGKKKTLSKNANFKVDLTKTFASTDELFIPAETSKLTGGRSFS